MTRRRSSSSATALARSVSLGLVGDVLAADLRQSLSAARSFGTVFPTAAEPLTVFRHALSESIRDVEHHPRGRLVQRFLRDGPACETASGQPDRTAASLTDDEVAATTAFICSFMVNSFKGSLVELLACEPCVRLVRELQARGDIPKAAMLFFGDSVMVAASRGSRFAKGADLHVLEVDRGVADTPSVDVVGVVEVKSYPLSQRRIGKQLQRHLDRAARGLRLGSQEISPNRIRCRARGGQPAVRIAVVPSSARLPRDFDIEETDSGHLLHVPPPEPASEGDRVVPLGGSDWRITLRWSKEAIASAAYQMTFWYMEKVGEVIYRAGVPPDWSEMTPAEAGTNAVKMMLYYSILRARTRAEEQRAVALYNTYGFGYALGMGFRNAAGQREMLWFRDLEEIARDGVTSRGCGLR